MPDRNRSCAIFIARHLDEYRVIYKSQKEWFIDAPETTITGARHRAEHCMQALYLQPGCKNKTIHVYELTIAGILYQALLDGLHNYEADWQHYLDEATKILIGRDDVIMASLVTDDSGSGDSQAPYLFVITSDMQTGEHTMDTIHLGRNQQHGDGAIIYTISQGKPRLYIDQAQSDNNNSPVTIDILPRRPALSA